MSQPTGGLFLPRGLIIPMAMGEHGNLFRLFNIVDLRVNLTTEVLGETGTFAGSNG